MTIEHVLQLVIGILGFLTSILVVWNFRMVLALNDRQTVSEEKSRNYTVDMERRLGEIRAEMDRRFAERKDDRLREQLMTEMQIRGANEKYEKEFIYINSQFGEIKSSMIALHKRLDLLLNSKASE